MFLSEVESDLNPILRSLLEAIHRRENIITIQTAAGLLNVSERRVYQLCDNGDLEFLSNPHRRILKTSLLKYVLKKHGLGHVRLD